MLGGLVGMAAADVAFVESAQAALAALLTGWRLPAGSRVACLPGEYAPNVAQLRAYGLRPEPLPVDGIGRADVEAVDRLLRDDPPPVRAPDPRGQPPRRGPARPGGRGAVPRRRRCPSSSTPPSRSATWTPTSAPTSSTAPRASGWPGRAGVGVLFVRPRLAAELTPVLPEPEGVPPMRAFESGEAHVAGRVGLVVAVGEHVAAGPDRVRERLAALGRATRSLLDGVGGWQVVEPADEPTATTTLRPAGRRRRLRDPRAAADRARHRHQRDRPRARPRRDDRARAADLAAPGRDRRRPRGPRRRPLKAELAIWP